MPELITIIIPNYNGEDTLDACLQAATAVRDDSVEIIVVDDGSTDNSIDIIECFPCQLILLSVNKGAAHARNIGAWHSHGEILFFTDADCLLKPDSLMQVRKGLSCGETNLVLGGTYTPLPHDRRFCSCFQSVFIHYSETRHMDNPDYLASHALAIRTEAFHTSGGFDEGMGPILEDVEFSHRLRRAGMTLRMQAGLQVQHIFNYSLLDSWHNALRKAYYWVRYSLINRDLLTDSGTASHELKWNVCSYYIGLGLLLASMASDTTVMLPVLALLAGVNLLFNQRLLFAFYRATPPLIAMGTIVYYLLVYPIPVGIGSLAGLMSSMFGRYHTGSQT